MHAVEQATARIRQLDVEICDELVRHEHRMQLLRESRAAAVRQGLEDAALERH